MNVYVYDPFCYEDSRLPEPNCSHYDKIKGVERIWEPITRDGALYSVENYAVHDFIKLLKDSGDCYRPKNAYGNNEDSK